MHMVVQGSPDPSGGTPFTSAVEAEQPRPFRHLLSGDSDDAARLPVAALRFGPHCIPV